MECAAHIANLVNPVSSANLANSKRTFTNFAYFTIRESLHPRKENKPSANRT